MIDPAKDDVAPGSSVHTDRSIQEPREIARVSIKIPPFWSAKPQLWFAQVESQFFAGGITKDETKYHTVVAAIESNVLTHVSDIILAPPASNMYKTLKERLIEQFADSEQKRIKKLLQDVELGDMRPSQLLREMRELAGKNMNDEMLKSIWLQRLPANIRSILSISSEGLQQMATLADKIVEVSDFSQISECSVNVVPPQASSLEMKVAELSRQLSEIRSSLLGNPRERSRSRARRRSKSTRSDHGKRQSDLCWYHETYGDAARKCRPPCKRNSEN